MTYQAPTTGSHSPTLLPFLQNSTDYIKLVQSWNFEVNCCSIGLTHPTACIRARVSLTLGLVHRPPPFPQFAQKGCQSTGLELRITKYIQHSMEVAQKKTGHPQKLPLKLRPHRGTTPPPPLSRPSLIELINIPIDSSQPQDCDNK